MTRLLPVDATPPFAQGPFVIRRIRPGLKDATVVPFLADPDAPASLAGSHSGPGGRR